MLWHLFWRFLNGVSWFDSNDTELYRRNGLVQWNRLGYEFHALALGQLNQRHSSRGQQRGAVPTELLGIWEYADHLSGSI
jgi:hypothetical protein